MTRSDTQRTTPLSVDEVWAAYERQCDVLEQAHRRWKAARVAEREACRRERDAWSAYLRAVEQRNVLARRALQGEALRMVRTGSTG